MVDNQNISKAMTIKLEDMFDDAMFLNAGISSWRPNFWKNCLPADGYTVTGSGLRGISKAGRSMNTAATASKARPFRS